MNVINRFLPPLLSTAILLFGGIQTAWADGRLTTEELILLIPILAGAIVTFWVPLFRGFWAGLWKTGAAALGALATLLLSLFVYGGVPAEAWVVFGLAVLNALATEIGVQVRQVAALVDARDSTSAPTPAPAAARELATSELADAAADTRALESATPPLPAA